MDDRRSSDLLAAHARGDEGAFSALVRRYEAPLLRYARCLCGVDAEDVVQDAFLKLARTPPRLPSSAADDPDLGSSALAAWLYQVTRNRAMETLRSERRRKVRENSNAAFERTDGDMQTLNDRETTAQVETAIARLPTDQREVLALRLLAERSYREIAEITGKKLGTVGWLIATGLSQLTRDLAPNVLAERGEKEGVR